MKCCGLKGMELWVISGAGYWKSFRVHWSLGFLLRVVEAIGFLGSIYISKSKPIRVRCVSILQTMRYVSTWRPKIHGCNCIFTKFFTQLPQYRHAGHRPNPLFHTPTPLSRSPRRVHDTDSSSHPHCSHSLPRSYLQNTSGIPAWTPLVLKLIKVGKYMQPTYLAVDKYSFYRTVVGAQFPRVLFCK